MINLIAGAFMFFGGMLEMHAGIQRVQRPTETYGPWEAYFGLVTMLFGLVVLALNSVAVWRSF